MERHHSDKLAQTTHEEIKERRKAQEREEKLLGISIYMKGYEQAVSDFSVWKDGRQTIGVMQYDPKQVVAEKREALRLEMGL